MAKVFPYEIIKPVSYVPSKAINVSFSNNPSAFCRSHFIRGENECEPTNEEAPSFSLNTLFIFVQEWNPTSKTDIIVKDENEAGDERIKLYRQKRFISFTAYVDQFYLDVLYTFALYQKWYITRDDDGSEFELNSFTVGNPTPVGKGYFTVAVTMGVKDAESVIDSCCGSAFEGAPYEDCTDATGTPTQPVECGDYAMNPLVYDATNGTLTATTVNQPAGTTETFKWYYFKDANSPVIILSNTAAVITVTDPGTYRAIATAGVCTTAPEDFLLSDDCGSFDALISQDGDYIILEPNRISTVVWERDIGGGFVPMVDTDLIIKPDTSGTYRATVTSGNCEVVRSIVVTLASCDFTVSINEVDDVLTAVISGYAGVDTPSYQWLLDNGSGDAALVGEVSESYTVLEPGYYTVEVTLDGCTKTASLLLLSACYAFNPYIDYVKPDGSGNVLIMSGHTGAPGAVNIEWWQVRNGEWVNIGSGASILTDEEGPTKMVAISENCTKERFTQACIDPDNPEWSERFVAILSQTTFTPTQVTIPVVAGMSEEEIGSEYELYRNGARLVYKHLANLSHKSEWSIDGSNIELNWPSNAGDVYVLVKRYIP